MFATIIKRLLLLTGALTMLASCSDDDSGLPNGYVMSIWAGTPIWRRDT